MGWNRTDSVAKRALADGVIDETGELEAMMPKADVTIVNFTRRQLLLLLKSIRIYSRKTALLPILAELKQKFAANLKRKILIFTS